MKGCLVFSRAVRLGITIMVLTGVTAFAAPPDRKAAAKPVAQPLAAPAPGAQQAPSPASNASVNGPHVGPVVWPSKMVKELRDLPRAQAFSLGLEPEGLPVRVPDWFPRPSAAPAVQAAPGGVAPRFGVHALAPTVGMNFNGLTGGNPPDENGAVGPRYFLQTINTSLAIYDKGTGTLVFSTSLLTFFGAGSTGTTCETEQRGDPVALYDSAADRYLVADLSRVDDNVGPWWVCVAVSQGPDPLGAWNFYAVGSGPAGPGELANRWLPDYPKLGVWPDGYYMMADMFDSVACPGSPGCGPGDLWDTFFTTVRVWALDRTAMLAGSPMTPISFDEPDEFSMVPTHMTNVGGAPPAGRVNYFGATDYPDPSAGGSSTTIHIYKFHADFAVPANSTWTGPFNVTVPVYTSPSTAPPMPGTNRVLDTLGTRLMYQFQYRNIGGTESLWGTHAIDQGGFCATRWYQFNVTGDPSPPTLVQSGTTVNGDSTHRWMPHLATDSFGNMAIEYSNSSASVNPGIRYNGRRVGEPPNTLQAEATLFTGPGVFGSCTPTPPATTCGTRWGDYSSMQVDPVDGCTFWFTNEYVGGGGGSATRIGTARFTEDCNCDVVMTKTDTGSDPAIANGPVTYQLTVTNPGAVAALNPVVTDTLAYPFVSVSPPAGWTCPSMPLVGLTGQLICTAASLAASGSATIYVTVTAPNLAGGTMSDTAAVTSNSFDTAAGNNSESETTTVLSPADVKGTKVWSSTWGNNLYPGAPITYTIVLTNSSANDQFDNPGDEFSDALPPQLTLTGASATSGTTTTVANVVHWNGTIPGLSSVTITINATINVGTSGQTVSNQGRIFCDLDGDGSNPPVDPDDATRFTDDPAVAGNENPTDFHVLTPVPTLTWLGIAAMVLLLAVVGALVLLRRYGI
jgi:uncharacterized repeat protein (TIGR01451 family)